MNENNYKSVLNLLYRLFQRNVCDTLKIKNLKAQRILNDIYNNRERTLLQKQHLIIKAKQDPQFQKVLKYLVKLAFFNQNIPDDMICRGCQNEFIYIDDWSYEKNYCGHCSVHKPVLETVRFKKLFRPHNPRRIKNMRYSMNRQYFNKMLKPTFLTYREFAKVIKIEYNKFDDILCNRYGISHELAKRIFSALVQWRPRRTYSGTTAPDENL